MKMPEDKIGKVMGRVEYVAWNENEEIIYEHKHDFPKEHNTVCDLYYDFLADHAAGGSDAIISDCHCGTGSGQGAADTNLDVPCPEIRTAVDSIAQGAAANSHIVTVITTFPAGICTASLEECGLFPSHASDAADMFLYDESLSFAKGALDTLVVTWTITHSN